MEVHFCDLCNESVPERDLKEGRAFLRKGRVVCASCDRAMSPPEEEAGGAPTGEAPSEAVAGAQAAGAGTPGGPHAGSGGHGPHYGSGGAGAGLAMVMAAMAILLIAAVAVLLFERMDDANRQSARDLSSLGSDLRGVVADVRTELLADAESRSGEAEALRRAIDALGQEVSGQAQSHREDVRRLTGEVEALTRRLDEGSAVAEELARHDRQIAELAGSIAEIRADLGLVAEKLVELQAQSEELAARPVAPLEPVDQGPDWLAYVDELASPSSGARWTAVQALGDTGDLGVVPHLLPMLGDEDIFVRMATARVLGDLGAVEGVPNLIDALEDVESTVREAAVLSLRLITGQNFKFDPGAADADRSKRVKAWRDWWRREGQASMG